MPTHVRGLPKILGQATTTENTYSESALNILNLTEQNLINSS
jgi:hypothetical protein